MCVEGCVTRATFEGGQNGGIFRGIARKAPGLLLYSIPTGPSPRQFRGEGGGSVVFPRRMFRVIHSFPFAQTQPVL